MSSVSCCSGGVMFVPDEIKRETKSKSYRDIAGEEYSSDAPKGKIFGAKSVSSKSSNGAVCTAA